MGLFSNYNNKNLFAPVPKDEKKKRKTITMHNVIIPNKKKSGK